MLLLPVLKQSSEVQGCSQIFASLWLLGLGAVLCTQQVTLSARCTGCWLASFPLCFLCRSQCIKTSSKGQGWVGGWGEGYAEGGGRLCGAVGH